MGALFGGGGGSNKQQAAMMQQQMAIQQRQQERIDQQEADQKAQIEARKRAARFGGMRSLISDASLGGAGSSNTASGNQPTLGAAG